MVQFLDVTFDLQDLCVDGAHQAHDLVGPHHEFVDAVVSEELDQFALVDDFLVTQVGIEVVVFIVSSTACILLELVVDGFLMVEEEVLDLLLHLWLLFGDVEQVPQLDEVLSPLYWRPSMEIDRCGSPGLVH